MSLKSPIEALSQTGTEIKKLQNV